MYICMTEEQKQEIERLNVQVVEVKQMLLKTVELIKSSWNDLIVALRRIFHSVGESVYLHQNSTPKERYQLVKRLNKCGFSEKEVNMMVYRAAFRCRNNC